MTESQILLDAAKIIEDVIKDEFIKQGHELSGDWENSIIIKDDGDEGIGIYATGYGMIVDAGTTPERIPYGDAGTGGDGISKYILGLVRFWKLRKPGISNKAALKLAFATAEVQKIEGMSTEGSKVYSTTGQRQHFMQAIEVLFNDYLDTFIFDGLDNIINSEADEPKIMYL